MKDPTLWHYTRRCDSKMASWSGMIPCYLEDGPVALDDAQKTNCVCVGCNRFRCEIDLETKRLQQEEQEGQR